MINFRVFGKKEVYRKYFNLSTLIECYISEKIFDKNKSKGYYV